MSFNANDFLASGGFNSSVTALVQAKTYNWSVGFSRRPCQHAVLQACHPILSSACVADSMVRVAAGSPTSMPPSCSVRAPLHACMLPVAKPCRSHHSCLLPAHNTFSLHLAASGYLVFSMQLGFALLTAGCVRAKSAKSVCLKNIMDAAFGGRGSVVHYQ